MYAVVLTLHSLLRWLLLGTGLGALVRSARGWRAGRDWGPEDEILARVFMMAFFIQGALGYLLLAELSPITSAALSDLPAAMGSPVLRFFVAEHPAGMITAFVIVCVGRGRTRNEDLGPARHKGWALCLACAALLFVFLVPWPGLQHGRPLLRALL